MTDQEEFEKWRIKFLDGEYSSALQSWQACAKQKNEIIKQQAKEIEVLLGFAEHVLRNQWCLSEAQVSMAKKYGLIDKNGDPTKLLTGEKQ